MTRSTTTPSRLATKQQAADAYGVSEGTIRNWIRKGYVTAYTAQRVRGVLVDLDEIDRMLDETPASKVHLGRPSQFGPDARVVPLTSTPAISGGTR